MTGCCAHLRCHPPEEWSFCLDPRISSCEVIWSGWRNLGEESVLGQGQIHLEAHSLVGLGKQGGEEGGGH